ncbi:MAG TPA: DNA-directed RNA polymerase subunit omega [Pyrinomonadaceae bacterium]|nr:DNA-directed RNA polymerase subunit omega [Pyrinomonadaceae bacterium]
MAKQAEKKAEAAERAEEGSPQLDSKYRLIIVAAQRSKQLQRGARPRVEGMDTQRHKPTRVALEEVQQGKISFHLTDNTDNAA